MDSQTIPDKESTNIIDGQAIFVTKKELDEESCWIAQAKQGSQSAFQRLYQQHHKSIYALCWRMLADKDSAEDVCQEVFVVLWQKINNFRGNARASSVCPRSLTWIDTHIIN